MLTISAGTHSNATAVLPKNRRARRLNLGSLFLLTILMLVALAMTPTFWITLYPDWNAENQRGGAAALPPPDGGDNTPTPQDGSFDFSDFLSAQLGQEINNAIHNETDVVFRALMATGSSATTGQPTIRILWRNMVLAANAMLALIIIINGYRIMVGAIGLRYAEAIETFPRIFLAALGANVSMAFISFWLMLNNALCFGTYEVAIRNVTRPTANDLDIFKVWAILIQSIFFTPFISIIARLMGSFWNDICKNSFFIPCINFEDKFKEAMHIAPDPFAPFFQFFIILLSLLILVQCIMRIGLLNLLIITSPLGMISWALPRGLGNGVFRLWMNALIATVFVQFLQLVVYGSGMALFNTLSDSPVIPHILNGFGIDLAHVITLWLVLRVPGWLQNSVVGTMGQASQTVVAMVNQAIMAVQQAVSTAVMVAR